MILLHGWLGSWGLWHETMTCLGQYYRTDLRPRLGEIKVPVMGMYGDRDNIVHPRQWKPLQQGVECTRIERYKKAGHFIMLNEPQNFQRTLRDFLDMPVEKNNEPSI